MIHRPFCPFAGPEVSGNPASGDVSDVIAPNSPAAHYRHFLGPHSTLTLIRFVS